MASLASTLSYVHQQSTVCLCCKARFSQIACVLQKDIVLWSGERGASYFFQAELPYDVSSYPYSGYTVADHVKVHESHGAGVYHFFRDHPVTVQSGIKCPKAMEDSFHSPLSVRPSVELSDSLSNSYLSFCVDFSVSSVYGLVCAERQRAVLTGVLERQRHDSACGQR